MLFVQFKPCIVFIQVSLLSYECGIFFNTTWTALNKCATLLVKYMHIYTTHKNFIFI